VHECFRGVCTAPAASLASRASLGPSWQPAPPVSQPRLRRGCGGGRSGRLWVLRSERDSRTRHGDSTRPTWRPPRLASKAAGTGQCLRVASFTLLPPCLRGGRPGGRSFARGEAR
jgi:hypothetical protein